MNYLDGINWNLFEEKTRKAVASALRQVPLSSGDKPNRSWVLTSGDKPGRSWTLTSGEIQTRVENALIAREPYNIRTLTASDKPDRSWTLTSGEIQTRVENALIAREPFNIRALTSGDKPNRSWSLSKTTDEVYGVLRTDAGVAYDARDRNWTLTSGEIQTRVENALIAREPYNIRTLGASDKPDRSWTLTSGEIQTRVENALASREPYNIRTLTASDKPDRSWVLGASDKPDRSWTLTSGDKPNRSWKLTSGDTPAAFILEPGGTFIDPRNIRFLTSGDTPRITHRAEGGNFLSNVTLGALASTDALVIDGPSFTIGIKKTAGPASMTVTHYVQLYPGGQWFEVADDTFNTDLVATFDHRVYAYRFKNKLSAASATVTVDYRIWK